MMEAHFSYEQLVLPEDPTPTDVCKAIEELIATESKRLTVDEQKVVREGLAILRTRLKQVPRFASVPVA